MPFLARNFCLTRGEGALFTCVRASSHLPRRNGWFEDIYFSAAFTLISFFSTGWCENWLNQIIDCPAPSLAYSLRCCLPPDPCSRALSAPRICIKLMSTPNRTLNRFTTSLGENANTRGYSQRNLHFSEMKTLDQSLSFSVSSCKLLGIGCLTTMGLICTVWYSCTT
jgi:hypothetical protein